ncbi:MAG: hypothetical protein WC254_07765 [Candidatus Woesearchaeota archaeon]|jgi:hypothetical protein
MISQLSSAVVEVKNLSSLELTLSEETSGHKERTESLLTRIGNGLYWLQEQYFKPHSFERDGKLYEALGVRTFKKYLPTGGDYICRLTGINWIKSKKELGPLNCMTRFYEATHTVFFILGTLQTVDAISEENYIEAGFKLAINILVNLYPIITQRYNRSRIYAIQEKRREMHYSY